MTDWEKHKPALILALILLLTVVILTIWQGFQPNDIEELKIATDNQTKVIDNMSKNYQDMIRRQEELINRIDKLLAQMEAQNVHANR